MKKYPSVPAANAFARLFVALLVATAAALLTPRSSAATYTFTTIAGVSPGSTDATGAAARFYNPQDAAVDSSGNVYVSDYANATIRMITPSGVVTTLAGLAGSTGSADGTGSAARFYHPYGVAVDSSGNVYVADTGNNTIREITSGGVVSTLAGTAGVSGSLDGTGPAAQFSGPLGIAVDSSGNVYVADTGNYTIRMIAPGGVVTTLAGSAGTLGTSNGTGSAALFGSPRGIATDSVGNLYVADSDLVRMIAPGAVVTTLAGGNPGNLDGTGTAARFEFLSGLAVDSNRVIYVSDSENDNIRIITPSGVVTTLAGPTATLSTSGSIDGTGTAARFYNPGGVGVDTMGNLFVADTSNDTIRKIAPGGVVTTFAGTATHGSADGIGSGAQFSSPYDVAVDGSGNLYVADFSNDTVRKIAPGGVVTTIAGTAGVSGWVDGIGAAVRFNEPTSVAVGISGTLYVVDANNNTVREITTSGAVTSFPRQAGVTPTGFSHNAYGVAVDSSGNVYVSNGDIVSELTSTGAQIYELGTLSAGSYDGTSPQFSEPANVSLDSSDNLYVADTGNRTIRKIAPGGNTTTIAGTAGVYGSADGTGPAAEFENPAGVAVDSQGNVFVADTQNNTIRMITPAGVVTTIGGTAGTLGSQDGIGTATRFDNPRGIAVDAAGNLFIADTGNGTIREGSIGTAVSISVQPTAQSAQAGTTATFTGAALGSPAPTFQWQVSTNGGSTFTNLTDGNGISGSATEVLSIADVPYAQDGYEYQLVATNPSGSVTSNAATLTVLLEVPVITSGASASASYNTTFNYAVTATGFPTSYSATGLPSGLAINSTTGIISGSPTATGTFTATVNAADGSGTGTAATLVISVAPIITTQPSPQTVLTGNPATFSVEAAGSPAPTYQWQYAGFQDVEFGNLSDGNGVSGSSTSQLTLSELSAPNTPLYGYYQVVVTSGGVSVTSASVQLTVNPITPVITSSLNVSATLGQLFSYTITATASPTAFSAIGAPNGLTFDPSTGVLSGIPTETGTYNVILNAGSPTTATGEATLVITVGSVAPGTPSAPAIVSVQAGDEQVTVNFSAPANPGNFPITGYTITATPVTGQAVTATGTSSPIIVTGLSGATSYTFTVAAINSAGTGTASSVSASVTPLGLPSITSNLSAGATFGTAFNYTIMGNSSPTSFTASGLPSGLSVNAASGVISGTPTVTGTFDVTIGAANAIGAGTGTLVITIAPGFSVPAISSSSQASGQVGIAFSYTILANNIPTDFNVSGLPAGLVYSATTGVISGTPTVAGTFVASLTASNAAGPGQAFALTIIVASATGTPAITSSATATGTVGPGFNYTITTSVPATSFAATGLPAGLSLNAATGVISGTPTVSGTTTVTITAANATDAGAPLSLIIVIQPSAQAPVITSSLTAAGTQGQLMAYAITGTNTPTSFTATGLPSGLTLNAATGAIAGTAANIGTSSVVLTASNTSGTSVPVILTITVNPTAAAPVIVSGNTAGGTVGSAFTYQIAANPAANSYAMTGGPAWLGIDTATGLLSGTPSGAPGTYVMVLSAINASGTSAPLALTIALAAAAGTPVVTSTNSPAAATAQDAYADTAGGCLYQIQVMPGAQIQYYFVNGALPAGLNLDPVLGLIFGTPTVPGTYTISVGAANLVGIGGAAAVTLTIDAAPGTPAISNTSGSNASALDRGEIRADGAPTADGSVGSAFSYQIQATGNPTSYAASNLPAGLAVNPSTGLITGLPTAAGTFITLISASNGIGIGASTDLIITISPPASAPTVSSSPTDSATAGTAYTYQMAASNAPTSFNASGLPTGLALNSTSGLISGTPTVPGAYSVSLSANNASGTGPVETLTLTVASAAGAPAITSPSTATGTVGSVFTAYAVTASNGPITSYSGSNLPPGLSLDPVGGAITGTPTVAGIYTATLTATNAAGPSSPFALSITVAPGATSSSVSSTTTAGATAGTAFSYQITATNSPISYNVTGLPSGLTVDTATGVISGTAGVAGTYPVQISVNNATGTGATFTLSISVINPSSYAYLSNLSARAYVNTGDNILIAGFSIGGSGSKQLLLRADGPALTVQNITDYLAEPEMVLYDSGNGPGESGSRIVAGNAGWGNNPTPGTSTLTTEIDATSSSLMNALGAYPVWAANSFDSALTATLPVNSFTYLVSGQGSAPTGIALAEIYDADAGIPAARLTNISARAEVGTGDNILIAGFVITGNTTETVLIRGVGTGLLAIDSNLTGLLAAPTISLYDSKGKVVATNTGWGNATTLGDSSVQAIVQPATSTIMNEVGAFPLTPTDCAMVVALPAGAYTMFLSGVNGSVGIGLVEVYEVP